MGHEEYIVEYNNQREHVPQKDVVSCGFNINVNKNELEERAMVNDEEKEMTEAEKDKMDEEVKADVGEKEGRISQWIPR